MDTYYVTRIEEPDFGCEGRPEGQEIKDKVYLKEECKKAYSDKFGKKGTYDLNASGVIYSNGLLEKVYTRILIKHRIKEK